MQGQKYRDAIHHLRSDSLSATTTAEQQDVIRALSRTLAAHQFKAMGIALDTETVAVVAERLIERLGDLVREATDEACAAAWGR